MKNKYNNASKWFIALILVFGSSSAVLAQRIVTVAQGVGTLNDAIEGDTTATGDRVDLNTIYELESGGIYKLTRSIENEISSGGYPLHIRTEAGYTDRAFLQPTPGTGGSTDRAFRVRGNLTLEGVHVTNAIDVGGFEDQIFRIYPDNTKVMIDDCVIDEAGQSAFRTDGENVRLFVTNSYISNIGLPNDPDNGRFIDTRRNDQDTIWLENNQVYNITSRWIRGEFDVNVLHINQNTFANCAQAGFQIGEVKNRLVFTNNILKNSQLYGRDTGDTEAIIEIEEYAGVPADMIISHNNVYWTPDVEAAYNAAADKELVQFLDSIGMANTVANGLENTNFSEDIAYVKAAPVPTDAYNDEINGTNNWAAWDRSGWPYNYDYSASGGPVSYTGGDSGQPVGGIVSTIGLPESFLSLGLELYPNPATSVLRIENTRYGEVILEKISIVNPTGQVVFEQKAAQGVLNEIEINGLPAGLYLVKVQAENEVAATQSFLKH